MNRHYSTAIIFRSILIKKNTKNVGTWKSAKSVSDNQYHINYVNDVEKNQEGEKCKVFLPSADIKLLKKGTKFENTSGHRERVLENHWQKFEWKAKPHIGKKHPTNYV